MHKMTRKFDVSAQNEKEMSNYLSCNGQKVDSHAVSIKHLEQKMTLLSTIVNQCQPFTFPRNTMKNPKNDGHSMTVIARGDKQTIDPPMPFWWKFILIEMMI